MNRMKLVFELENNKLPKEMDRLVLSFFKAAVQSYSTELFNALYDKSRSIMKTYTYSLNLPGAMFLSDNIVLNKNEFYIHFSDSDIQEFMHFFNAFQNFKFKKHPMYRNSMSLRSVSVYNVEPITDDEVVVRMKSPLIVRRHNKSDNSDTYFTCEDSQFENMLRDNVNIFLEKLSLPVDAGAFQADVVKGRKIVVPVFGRNTDASLGIFKLRGSVELLNLLYMSGLGVRRSEGHGLFDVIA